MILPASGIALSATRCLFSVPISVCLLHDIFSKLHTDPVFEQQQADEVGHRVVCHRHGVVFDHVFQLSGVKA